MEKQFDLLQALLDTDFKPEKDISMKRFGPEATFRIRAFDETERKRVLEQSTYPNKKGEVLDEDKFRKLLIAKGCVRPDWNDPRLLTGLGVSDAIEAIGKRLLPGEIMRLSEEISKLSGYGTEFDDLKN